jgi:GNAT superfamily N-acetyltransferase
MPRLPPSPLPDLRVIELGAGSEPLLQAFFEANPIYFQLTQGQPPQPNEAHEELHGELPSGWSFTKIWFVGYIDAQGSLVAMANIVSDLLAPCVWHIGTFFVAGSRQGTGDAQVLYQSLESWASDEGAKWFRLGVVQGNDRAERFWERQGFTQTRVRNGVVMGRLTNTVRAMVKPLAGGTIAQYLALVQRDRPDD